MTPAIVLAPSSQVRGFSPGSTAPCDAAVRTLSRNADAALGTLKSDAGTDAWMQRKTEGKAQGSTGQVGCNDSTALRL